MFCAQSRANRRRNGHIASYDLGYKEGRMGTHIVARASVVLLVIAAVLMLVVPVANAAPPSNDNFNNATAISLPYNATEDTSEATEDVNDPQFCNGSQAATVWYSLTVAESLMINANTFGSGYNASITVVTGSPGFFQFVACGSSLQFVATTRQTYYFMIAAVVLPYPAPNHDPVFSLTGTTLPPPGAGFSYYPFDPSIYDASPVNHFSYHPVVGRIR